MNNNAYIKQYKSGLVTTASPEQVLILLYDGCIRYVQQAIVAMEAKDVQNTHTNIRRAQDILTEFINSLNFEANEDIATRLKKMYEDFIGVLSTANIKKDTERLKFMVEQLTGLRDAWKKAVDSSMKDISKLDFGDDYEFEKEVEDGVDYEL